MKQAFTEAWGKKVKDNFSPTVLATFNTTLQRLLKKINILGAANLPAGERNEVSLLLSTSYQSVITSFESDSDVVYNVILKCQNICSRCYKT